VPFSASVHALLDKTRITVETLFAEWNASKDGWLTAAQFSSGCRRAGVQVPLAHLVEMFRQLDAGALLSLRSFAVDFRCVIATAIS
jgi:hypothetical protein